MRLVLDTNEYVAALGWVKNPASELLLTKLIKSPSEYVLLIPRAIVNEARRNLPPILFTQFIKIIQAVSSIDEDNQVPFETGAKYESLGLKSADAFIAGYCEWASADILVSENRHFLSRKSNLPFRVLNAADCLKSLE